MFVLMKTLKGCVAGLILALPIAALAETELRLSAGDSISFTVVGTPSLDRISTIDLDGVIHLPVVGRVEASGRTLQELRWVIVDRMSRSAVRVGGATGQDTWRQVQREEVIVDVAEYRPVFVTGDVRSGGQVPYRPGINARHALAIAGGVGIPLLEEVGPLEVLALASERDQLVLRVKTQENVVQRLQADLRALEASADTTPLERGGPDRDEAVQDAQSADASSEAPQPAGGDSKAGPAARTEASRQDIDTIHHPPDTEGFRAVEQTGEHWLAARAEMRDLMAGNLDLRLQQMQSRLETLEQLEATDQESLALEQEEYERMQQLSERGIVPSANLTGARRGLLQSSSQMLQSSETLLQQRLDLVRTEDETRIDRTSARVELLSQLTGELAELESVRQQLRALDERIQLLGGATMVAGDAVVEMEIYRTDVEEPIDVTTELETLLLPGDVLQVTASFPTAENE